MPFKIIDVVKSPIHGSIKVIQNTDSSIYLTSSDVIQSGNLIQKIWKIALSEINKKSIEINRILILGVGAGSILTPIIEFWPNTHITGIEIDAVMLELGSKYFKLDKIKNLNIIQVDVMEWILKNNKELFDLILVDLYIGSLIPENSNSNIFLRQLSTLIVNKGVVAFNYLYLYHEDKRIAERIGARLKEIFPCIDIIYPENNIIYICSKK